MVQRLPVLIIMLATPAAAFITPTTVRGAAFQAPPLVVRGAGARGVVVPGMRKGALAPALVRHETRMETSWSQASKAQVCGSNPT